MEIHENGVCEEDIIMGEAPIDGEQELVSEAGEVVEETFTERPGRGDILLTEETFRLEHPTLGVALNRFYDAPVTGGGQGWLDVWNGRKQYRQNGTQNDTLGVMHMQRLLTQIGYGPNNVGAITINGIYDTVTANAIRFFQKECQNLAEDGICGTATARMLENVQHDEIFRAIEYAPVKASLMTYNTYPNYGNSYATQLSILCRCVFGEHAYPGDTSLGHRYARAGVAKVLDNRKDNMSIAHANNNDRTWKSVYFAPNQYTGTKNEFALTLPRGYDTFWDVLFVGEKLYNGQWPTDAPKVNKTHLFQKGYRSNDPSRPGYVRYPESGSIFTWFHY